MKKTDQKHSLADSADATGWEDIGPKWKVPVLAGLLAVATACLVLASTAVAYQLIHSNVIYPGVEVAGIPVGGMTKEDALAAVKPIYEQRAKRSLLFRMDGVERKMVLSEIGVSFDPEAGVDTAYKIGRTGGPLERIGSQLSALVRGNSVESSGVRIDRAKLQSVITQIAGEIDRTVKDAELVIGDDFSVQISPDVIGRRLDVEGAVGAIEKAVITGADSVELPVLITLPKRLEKDLVEARDTLAKVYSGAVTLQFGGNSWALEQKEISDIVSVDYKTGVPAPEITIREESLTALADRIAGEIEQEKVDGRYVWSNGALTLLSEGKDGLKLDRAKTVDALRSAIMGDQKIVDLPVDVDEAIGDSIDPAKLSIKERIEYGQTTIAGVPEKVHNIKLAASRLNGVVVRPGETFSFNDELGPTTIKAGFQVGFGITINNGEMQTVPSVAGGICQVATTLLHAVFWAGYQIEERYPHMYWISSYGQPPRGITGLDSTVEAPVLDFKFTNNTDDYLLIQSSTENSKLTFELYGTKPDWKVEVEGPIISNVVKADQKEVRQEEPTWPEGRTLWVERAADGFDVEIIRKVIKGDDVRTLNLKSRYQPSRNVLMVGTKKPDPTPVPTPSASPTPSAGSSPTPSAGGDPQAAPTALPTPENGEAPPAANTPQPTPSQ
ncbi:MAG: VanW family protein [Chloroflexota bacterium]|jgi:vancomycin resistance protein YoaR